MIVWDLTGTLNCDSELIKNSTHWSNMIQSSRVQESTVVRDAETSDNNVSLLEKVDDIAEASINSCQFYGDDLLATGSRYFTRDEKNVLTMIWFFFSDKMVRLFKVDSNRSGVLEEMDFSPLEGHTYSVNHVEFSTKGDMLASCSLDGWTIVWSVVINQ